MRKFLPAILLAFCYLTVSAQKQVDYSFSLGVSNYLGEIGGKEKARQGFIGDLKIKSTRYEVGGHVRFRMSPVFGMSMNLMYGRITNADSNSTNFGRRYRNLHFRTGITEVSTQGEFTFFKFKRYGHSYLLTKTRGRTRIDVSFYTFLGVGGIYFNPKAQLNNIWYALQPLGTEGQGVVDGRDKYSRFAMIIPMGLGYYSTINRNLRIGVELGLRKTFTDYLDDISTTYVDPSLLSSTAAELANRTAERIAIDGTDDPLTETYYEPGDKRGDPKHNDSYFFGVLKVGYAMPARRSSSSFGLGKMFSTKKGRHSNHRFGSRPKYRR
ncbi:MAG: hypothetical protein H6585_11065 [Flavobacteriales bacterium]|nr:hypothetical protein [Flavobacteriales bacterium]MCB9448874.1 hypothetical protein [Flavobacteriales bacterium]